MKQIINEAIEHTSFAYVRLYHLHVLHNEIRNNNGKLNVTINDVLIQTTIIKSQRTIDII